MTVGDKDCCSRPYCGHGEAYHDIRQGKRFGPCELCRGRSGKYRCRSFAPPLKVKGGVTGPDAITLICLGEKFWYNFEGDKDFPKDPVGWIECKWVDDEWGSIVVKPKGYEKLVISRRHIAKRGAVAKPQEAMA